MIDDGTGNASIGTSLTTKDITANGALSIGFNAITMTSGTVIDAGGGWHRSYGNTGWYNGTYFGLGAAARCPK
jgi:hypothetical protein